MTWKGLVPTRRTYNSGTIFERVTLGEAEGDTLLSKRKGCWPTPAVCRGERRLREGGAWPRGL